MEDKVVDEVGSNGSENYFEQMETVNERLTELVKLLIDHLKGDEVEYQYEYGQGWTVEKHNSMKDKLDEEDPSKKIEAVETLLDQYSKDQGG